MGLVSPVECVSMEEVKSVFDTNVFGVIRMIKAVVPDMKKRRSGHIIYISSTMGLQGVCMCVYRFLYLCEDQMSTSFLFILQMKTQVWFRCIMVLTKII